MTAKVRQLNGLMVAASVLLCLTLLTTHLLGGMYARYVTKASAQDGAQVAAYVFDVRNSREEAEFTLDLTGMKQPGSEVACQFLVTNEKNGAVCEVAQRYTVYIDSYGSLPLTCSLNGQAVTLSDPEASFQGALAAGTPDADTLTLTVLWPSGQNDLTCIGGAASLHVRIVAEQLD